MEIDYRIEPHYIHFRLEGAFDVDQVLALLDEVSGHPDFRDDLGFLWDLRDVDPDSVKPSHVPIVTERAKRIASDRHPGNVAFLVANNVGYGMSRIASVHAETERRKSRVFRDEHEAIAFAAGTDA